MIPKAGEKVKILIAPSTWVEGVVVTWSPIVLNNKNVTTVIENKENIILFQIEKDLSETKAIVDQKIEEVKTEPSNEDRIKSLAELKIAKNQIDREIIINKMKEHTISAPAGAVKYGNIDFFKK